MQKIPYPSSDTSVHAEAGSPLLARFVKVSAPERYAYSSVHSQATTIFSLPSIN